jgi:RND family efflux transporter MFP subunit
MSILAMKKFPLRGRTLALLVVILPLLALFIYVGMRSGPLAPVAVKVATVTLQSISPSLFGIGTVEARYSYRIGPTAAGRVGRIDVQVGDTVTAGQVIGEMDPIDLDERLRSLDAAFAKAQASVREAEARHSYAKTQTQRYEKLFIAGSTSDELVGARQQEVRIAEAALAATRQELLRTDADRQALAAAIGSLQLIAPADGIIAARHVEPGTTLVAGQPAIEIFDPSSLWINVRFDQTHSAALAQMQATRIVLRSRHEQTLSGKVLRVEPKADAVTEETLVKVIFDSIPQPLPLIGELAEVTVTLPEMPPLPTIPNAAIVHQGSKTGVWMIINDQLQFRPIQLGTADLEGSVQVRTGLDQGEQIVVYSEKTLQANRRIKIVTQMPGVKP